MCLAIIALISLLAPDVSGQTDPVAKLEIRVVKRTHADRNPIPFPGVGLFGLIRGQAKFEGGSCPDKSNANGTVLCSIKCRAQEKEPITIRVQPPTNQDHLAGWTTPPGTAPDRGDL